MRAKSVVVSMVLLTVAPLVFPQDGIAQSSPAHAHIGHVADAFRGTPDGMGLLGAAQAEAAVAAQHAGFAARDLTDLDGMKRHMGHVLHALNPEEAESGPGAGYGALAAAQGVARHIALAAASEGASDGVRTHANHVATSANNTVERIEKMIELAKSVQESESASDAEEMVEELAALGALLAAGDDADGDGRIGWQEGEGGLDASATHVGLMKRGEGLGG